MYNLCFTASYYLSCYMLVSKIVHIKYELTSYVASLEEIGKSLESLFLFFFSSGSLYISIAFLHCIGSFRCLSLDLRMT